MDAYQILQATHASIVVTKGGQQWTLFTGTKLEANKALDAMGAILNIAGADQTGLTATLVYHSNKDTN